MRRQPGGALIQNPLVQQQELQGAKPLQRSSRSPSFRPGPESVGTRSGMVGFQPERRRIINGEGPHPAEDRRLAPDFNGKAGKNSFQPVKKIARMTCAAGQPPDFSQAGLDG